MSTNSSTSPKWASDVLTKLQAMGDKKHALLLQRFFKTGPGEYAEGDIFAGLRVPQIRKVAIECYDLPLIEIIKLLHSNIHESRLLSLLLLIRAYANGSPEMKNVIYKTYLNSTRFINNWDLVDISAGQIVGRHLMDRSRAPLYKLCRSGLLWERRISILATSYFIKYGEFDETLKIAAILLKDKEDLIHKAVGWMLREVGKRDFAAEEAFLKKHYRKMPRTMLRYSIEKFPEKLRRQYIKGTIQ